jgi:hypothetical protein
MLLKMHELSVWISRDSQFFCGVEWQNNLAGKGCQKARINFKNLQISLSVFAGRSLG